MVNNYTHYNIIIITHCITLLYLNMDHNKAGISFIPRVGNESAKDLEIDLLSKENRLVIEALHLAVNTQTSELEKEEMMAKLRELVNQAATEQEAIDYIESKRQPQNLNAAM